MATVLIADDSAFMRSSLKFIVEKSGHEVIGAVEDGVRAVELYRELKPDLVTLDILMEGGDGLTALREIMKDDPDARVIMVSALGQREKQEGGTVQRSGGPHGHGGCNAVAQQRGYENVRATPRLAGLKGA